MRHSTLVIMFCLALAAASCGTAGEVATAVGPTSSTAPPAAAGPPETGTDTTGTDETLVLDRGPGAPTIANHVPVVGPDEPVGRIGFTRYVYVRAGGDVIPALVEGPVRDQVRCQTVALPCSADDLRSLAAAGEEPPAALRLTSSELTSLVSELDAVAAAIDSYPSPEVACAAGFRPDRTQTPNMGSHFVSMDRILDGEFDPGRPEIIMFARPDGVAPDGPLGECTSTGGWDGVDAEPVGVAFFQPFAFVGDDHFDGFTGSLDNWHVHYNLCRLDGRDITVPPDVCAGQRGTPGEFEPGQGPVGEASEGWMIHAWADPDHDAQLGVFSMWNPSIWPITAPDALSTLADLDTRRGAGTEVIDDFTLPDVVLDEPGSIIFFNADGVTHTITAGTPAAPADGGFDSGLVASRSVTTIDVDQTGAIAYFCTLHPDMQGLITVG